MARLSPLPLSVLLLGLSLAARPLSAACPTCTVSASPDLPDLMLSGTTAGTCGDSFVRFSIDGSQILASQHCLDPACTYAPKLDVSCKRTGQQYTAFNRCICGVTVTNPDGTTKCEPGFADASATSSAPGATPGRAMTS